MSISFVAASTGTTGAGGGQSISINAPTGLQVGDLMLMFVDSQPTISATPTGWAQVIAPITGAGIGGSFASHGAVYSKAAVSGDVGGSFSVSLDVGGSAAPSVAVVVAYRNAALDVSTSSTTQATTFSVPRVTTTQSDDYVVHAAVSHTTATTAPSVTLDAAFTQRANLAQSATNDDARTIAVGDVAQPTAGLSVSGTDTDAGANNEWLGFTVALSLVATPISASDSGTATETAPGVRLTEVAVEAAVTGFQANTRVSQVAVETAFTGLQANARLSQVAVEVAIGPVRITASDSGASSPSASSSATVSASDSGTITEAYKIQYLVTDTYDRVDNASSLTTTSDGTSIWTTRLGTMGVSSNTAYASAVPGMATIVAPGTPAQADGTLQVTVPTFGTVGDAAGLAFRATDSNNYYCFVVSSTAAKLIRVQAGVVTVDHTWAGSHSAGDVLTVVLEGTSVTCEVNGSALGTVTESFNASEVNWGIYADDSGFRLNDFSLLVPGSFDPDAADSGSGSELVTLSAANAATDAGAVTDTGIVPVNIVASDSGVATASGALVFGVTDAGTSSSSGSIAATLAASDAAVGGEGLGASIVASDAGTASNVAAISSAASDSGSIAASYSIGLAASDAGVASNAISSTLLASDSGVVASTARIGPVAFDSGAVTEATGFAALNITDADSAVLYLELGTVVPTIPSTGTNSTPPSPGAVGVVRWAFVDPAGAVATYLFEVNPNKMTDPTLKKVTHTLGISPVRTVSRAWRQNSSVPREWTFSGITVSQAQQDAFNTWYALNRRIWLRDHFGRIFEVRLIKFAPEPRKPTKKNVLWRFQYTFTATVYRRVA